MKEKSICPVCRFSEKCAFPLLICVEKSPGPVPHLHGPRMTFEFCMSPYSHITNLEDRLRKERNLRKDFYESEELQKGRRTCSSSSDSDDDRNRNSSSPSDTDNAGKATRLA